VKISMQGIISQHEQVWQSWGCRNEGTAILLIPSLWCVCSFANTFYLKNIQNKHSTMKKKKKPTKSPKPKKLNFCKNTWESWKIHSAAEPVFFPYYELQWKSKTTDLGTKGESGQLAMDGLHWNTIWF